MVQPPIALIGMTLQDTNRSAWLAVVGILRFRSLFCLQLFFFKRNVLDVFVLVTACKTIDELLSVSCTDSRQRFACRPNLEARAKTPVNGQSPMVDRELSCQD